MIIDTSPTIAEESAADAAPTPRWHAVVLFFVLAGGYFTIGAILSVRYNVFDGDGLSRVANTGFALLSRDPHLSAIGFVWNPLPTLAEIPFMPLSRWWPQFKTHGLAGIAQSGLFMAGSALMIRKIAIDRRVGSLWRRTAVGCFALHPIIILMAGFGLSEAATTFCLLWCVRHALQWVTANRTGDLAWAGVALGVGYLARYEVLPSVVGVAMLLGAVSYYRASPEIRWQSSVLSVVLVAFPSVVAFIVLALSSWIVTGELFATLTSMYGNASQVAAAHARSGETGFTTGNWRLITAQLLVMQPFTLIAIAIAGVVAATRNRVDPLVPLAVFGSMLAFTAWGQFTGTTFNLFRYYLPAVPMVVAIALTCWPVAHPPTRGRPEVLITRAGAVLITLSALVGLPGTARAVLNNDLGLRPQFNALTSLFDGRRHNSPELDRRIGQEDRLVATYLDRRHLPAGSVLMDTNASWLIWLASDNPQQFVVTSDYDFTAVLNRPWKFGVQYIVVGAPGSPVANAIQLRYPSIAEDGAGFGELVYSVTGPTGEERWRVFRVVEPSDSPGGATLTQSPKPGG